METKIFGDKKIVIRKFLKSDLKDIKKFLNFISALVEEGAKVLINEKPTPASQKKYLEKVQEGIKNRQRVQLIAECNNEVIGMTDIELNSWNMDHIGNLGIVIKKDYRGLGIGNHLLVEIIKLASKELMPKPKIIRLEAYSNNKPAINLYKKFKFKIVARVPKQLQYRGKLIAGIIMLRDL